jgi:hypothetical protein
VVEKDEQIKRFFELCENLVFPHREELLRGIETGEYLLKNHSNLKVPSSELLDIYGRRAKHLMKYKSNHAQRLRGEVLIFLDNLEKLSNEKVKFWSFSKDEASSYDIFEGVNSQKILGCFLTVSKEKVAESEWEKLWSEE